MFVNWRPASTFSHRVAQVLCSAKTIFLEDTNKITFRNVFGIGAGNEKCRPRKDTNKIKFRNAFGIGAGNEKCQKIFYDINILDQKNHIFAEDNFLILELQFCSWTEDPSVLLAIALHRFYAAQRRYKQNWILLVSSQNIVFGLHKTCATRCVKILPSLHCSVHEKKCSSKIKKLSSAKMRFFRSKIFMAQNDFLHFSLTAFMQNALGN